MRPGSCNAAAVIYKRNPLANHATIFAILVIGWVIVFTKLAAAACPARVAAALGACPIHEDAAHCLGCRREELAATCPLPNLVNIDKPNVRFMDEGSGLKRLAGVFS